MRKVISEKNRIVWADCAKFVCIMFVMLSHLESNTQIMQLFYQPFFLSTFFFVSGYVYKHNCGLKQLIQKKSRCLILPWAIFSLFTITLSQVVSFNEQGSFGSELVWNILQIRGKGDEVWFLPALFVAFIPFYFSVKWYQNSQRSQKFRIVSVTAVTFLFSLISLLYTKLMDPSLLPWDSVSLPWHIEYIFQGSFFMWLGYLYRDSGEKIHNKFNNVVAFLSILGIYLLIVYSPMIFRFEIATILGSVFFHYLSSIVGILLVVSFCKMLKYNRIVSFIGQNTVIYFALHGKVYSLIQTMLHKFADEIYFNILGNTVQSVLLSIVLTFIVAAILIIPAYIINRWFPFVLGKKRKREV